MTDPRPDFAALLDAYGRSIAFGSRVEQNEARAAVVAEYEQKFTDMLTWAQKASDLTAALAAEQERDEWARQADEMGKLLRSKV